MRQMRRHSVGIGSWITMGLLLGTPGALAGDFAGQITASAGVVEGGQQGILGEGEHVSLDGEGGCSILVDQDSLVELCGDTSLALRKERNRRVVALDRGEIRLVVEPRTFDKRVEIHTPSAIATLLGTIVHVSVDEAGVTTISSAESKISVRSSNPEIRGTTVIDTAEQVTVVPGQAPPARSNLLEPVQLAALGGCLVDFHSAAIARDVTAHANEVTARLAAHDAVAYSGPEGPVPIGLRPPGISASGDPVAVESIASQEDICTATECGSDNMAEFEPGQDSQGQGPTGMY